MHDFFPFLLLLALLAIILHDDTVLTLFYLLVGVYFVSRAWRDRALQAVTIKRLYPERAFPGEQVTVRLELANRGWLPVVWLRLHDSRPVELAGHQFLQTVISLAPHEEAHFEYTLAAYKRGYYRLGPLLLNSGDVLGLTEEQGRAGPTDYLTVYPRIVPLSSLTLPSHAPLGTLRHKQPIFEDPTRITGKRDYVTGDSLRRVDWKATAAAGRLQVKQFEPSIALETVLFLNLNAADYEARSHYDAMELSVVVAASVASRVIALKQSVGLLANGADPLYANGCPPALPARKGRQHLMRLLEVMARLQLSETAPRLPDRLRRELVNLAWGTTLVIITGLADEALLDALFQARRAGLDAVLILTSPGAGVDQVRRRVGRFGFPVYHFTREQDLDIWRR